MMNVIRRSQIIGLLDRSPVTGYGRIDEVWVDESGRVSYFSSDQGYIPFEEVTVLEPDIRLRDWDMKTPSQIFRQYTPIRFSRSRDRVGWIEDFLFDWETGDIVAYILGGEIASPFGDRAVLFPEDVEVIDTDAVVIKEGAKDRLKREAEGLKGFLGEKSQQVKHFIKRMRDRLSASFIPDDQPKTVRVKVKPVEDQVAASGKPDHKPMQEQWQQLQHRARKAGKQMKKAVNKAWHRLTHQ